MARTSASSRPLTDHDEIRRWAEQRDAKPACVRGTGKSDDIGMIRLDFPGYSGEGKLEEISWDEWFQKFEESGLALLVQEKTARGEPSNFNKLVSRERAGVLEEGPGSRRQSRSADPSPAEIDEEEYAQSDEDISDENVSDEDESADEDMEEEIELEETGLRVSANRNSRNPDNRSARSASSNRKSPGRVVAGGKETRTSRSSARGVKPADARKRSRKTSSSRSTDIRRGATSSGSRSSASRSSASKSTAKKAPARARTASSRSSRGRSSSSRKRAA